VQAERHINILIDGTKHSIPRLTTVVTGNQMYVYKLLFICH